jgi:hypothetical protein
MEFTENHSDSIGIFRTEKYINNLVMIFSLINKGQSAFVCFTIIFKGTGPESDIGF